MKRLTCATSTALLLGAIALPAKAQVVPDGSLPAEVRQTGARFDIDGGSRVGENLFHSFREFSVPTGGEAVFNNAPDVANIFSRVTGGNPSAIDGWIRTNGSANLFLLNPAGLLFGPNARLDLGGSFFATTADRMTFADGTEFDAAIGVEAPLLTASVPAGLQVGAAPGAIRLAGANLQVAPGENLVLVGGPVVLEGARLVVPDGRVELAGVGREGAVTFGAATAAAQGDAAGQEPAGADNAESGKVGANVAGSNVAGSNVAGSNVAGSNFAGLNFVEGDGGAPVTLAANSAIAVDGGGGGSIALRGSAIALTDSTLDAGIAPNGGAFGIDAGRIDLTAAGPIALERSQIRNRVGLDGRGNAGPVTLTGESVALLGGSRLDASTAGQGNAGRIAIAARDRVVVARTEPISGQPGGAFSFVESEATGDAGGIIITGRSLEVRDGGALDSSTRGRGNAGGVTATVTGSVLFAGTAPDGTTASGAFSSIRRPADKDDAPRGERRAGGIRIEAGEEVIVADGATLDSSTFSLGNGGAATVRAGGTARFVGTAPDGTPGGVFTGVGPAGRGNGGAIAVRAARVEVLDGARLSSSVSGQGNGGAIVVRADGNLDIAGTAPDGTTFSSIASRLEASGVGSSGAIDLTARSLEARDGGAIDASTQGTGDAGRIDIDTREVRFLGTTPGDSSPSGAFAGVLRAAIGNASGIVIRADTVELRDGARIDSSSFGAGNAGIIDLQAGDRVTATGQRQNGEPGGIFSGVGGRNGDGNAGGIRIEADTVALRNGARLSSVNDLAVKNDYTAGNVRIEAEVVRLEDAPSILANSQGQEGNVIVNAETLILRGESRIATNARGGYAGGNIRIDMDRDRPSILAAIENSDITANANSSRGGTVRVQAGIFGTEFRTALTPESDITATSQLGSAFSGEVQLNTPEIDPTSGLLELPTAPVDAAALVGQDFCSQQGEDSEFVVTGRGGLPERPGASLDPSSAIARPIDPLTDSADSAPDFPAQTPGDRESAAVPPGDRLFEASGWAIAPDGRVTLVAAPPDRLPRFSTPTCPASDRQ